MNDTTGWTVAYRAPDEPVFHRVDLNISWGEATVVAGKFLDALPRTYEVWTIPNRAAELTDRVSRRDVLNILVEEDVRVPIADDGASLDALRAGARPQPAPGGRR